MSTKVTDSKVKSLKYKDIKSMSLGDRLNIKIDKDLNIFMRGPVSDIKYTKLEI